EPDRWSVQAGEALPLLVRGIGNQAETVDQGATIACRARRGRSPPRPARSCSSRRSSCPSPAGRVARSADPRHGLGGPGLVELCVNLGHDLRGMAPDGPRDVQAELPADSRPGAMAELVRMLVRHTGPLASAGDGPTVGVRIVLFAGDPLGSRFGAVPLTSLS